MIYISLNHFNKVWKSFDWSLTVKEHLLILAEDGNRKFTEGLHPGVEHVLGIRLPALRKLAARIAKADWERYFDTADGFYMEERMLQGMVLGCIRPDEDVEVYLHRVTRFCVDYQQLVGVRYV